MSSASKPCPFRTMVFVIAYLEALLRERGFCGGNCGGSAGRFGFKDPRGTRFNA